MRCVKILLVLIVLGFTVGDELGFGESLSNVEGNRRRSTQTNRFQNVLLDNQNKNNVQKLAATQTYALRLNNTNQNKIEKPNDKVKMSVPPFKPIPPAPERPVVDLTNDMIKMTAINLTQSQKMGTVPLPALSGIVVPVFQAIPSSISRISPDQHFHANITNYSKIVQPIDSQVTAETKDVNKFLNIVKPEYTTTETPIPVNKLVQIISSFPNISMDVIEAAILYRQKQLSKQNEIVSVNTQTTTAVPSKKQYNTNNKVMNAPKEYYPVGYDKNFDDNFASTVELPETSFTCQQKHFPGLYADEDFGCMVFHVCALGQDGLIMKSFLCPESTLFDQTVLKCNYYFYVDCKNSKKYYDSNLPLSKSYQLIKALQFFSAYKQEQMNQ